MSAKQYRPWLPTQSFLLPPSPSEWLPESDLAYFVLEVVASLDLSEIVRVYEAKDPRGTRPYDPRMLTALMLYGYCVGVRSSRKMEAATYRDVAFRVLAGGEHPDHTSLSEFRRVHLEALGRLFLATVRMAQKAGLVKLGMVALDGTKVAANASKHRAMSYDRMPKSEAQLRQEIKRILAEAEATDRAEDDLYGPDRRGDEVPEELRTHEGRLRRIQQAKAELEAEARQVREAELAEQAKRQREQADKAPDPPERKRAATRAAKAEEQAAKVREAGRGKPKAEDGRAEGDGDLPFHRVEATVEGKPSPKAQRNFTDPQSRIMKRDGTYLQGYNCQAVVDAERQVIVAAALTNQSPDQEHLPPLLERVRANCGRYPDKLLADNGYWAGAHVTYCEERGTQAYIAAGRYKHGQRPEPVEGPPPDGLDVKARMAWLLRTPEGRAVYARRKVIVEPVFGQVRETQGFQRFLLRGLRGAKGEYLLTCAAHNLRKLHKAVQGGLATLLEALEPDPLPTLA
jgi:transposase